MKKNIEIDEKVVTRPQISPHNVQGRIAVKRHLNNMIATYGEENVLNWIALEYGLIQTTDHKQKLKAS